MFLVPPLRMRGAILSQFLFPDPNPTPIAWPLSFRLVGGGEREDATTIVLKI